MQLILNTEQKIAILCKPGTSKGNPADIDGKPTWTLEGPGTLNVSEEGRSATLISPDEIGTARITVSADADLGEGVENIQDTIDVTYVHPKAANVGLSVGTPEDK